MQLNQNSGGGIGVLGLLGLIFVTLKLCGVINWSWWWVTAPFWGGFAIIIVFFILVALVAGGVCVCESAANGIRRTKK